MRTYRFDTLFLNLSAPRHPQGHEISSTGILLRVFLFIGVPRHLSCHTSIPFWLLTRRQWCSSHTLHRCYCQHLGILLSRHDLAQFSHKSRCVVAPFANISHLTPRLYLLVSVSNPWRPSSNRLFHYWDPLLKRSQHDPKLRSWQSLQHYDKPHAWNVLGMTVNCIYETEYITRATTRSVWNEDLQFFGVDSSFTWCNKKL